jgi:hypothetical protein
MGEQPTNFWGLGRLEMRQCEADQMHSRPTHLEQVCERSGRDGLLDQRVGLWAAVAASHLHNPASRLQPIATWTALNYHFLHSIKCKGSTGT